MHTNNHEFLAHGEGAHRHESNGEVARIIPGETKWMMIEKANLDHDCIPVNKEFHEGFKAALEICNDPEKLERYQRMCDFESDLDAAHSGIMRMTADWLGEQGNRIVSAFLFSRPDGSLFFEFVTPGGNYDHDMAEKITELIESLGDAFPQVFVTIDGIAEVVHKNA